MKSSAEVPGGLERKVMPERTGGRAASFPVHLTDQTLSCAARARVPKPERRTACTHVSRAMQAARRRRVLILTRRLGRRTEAGPRQLLRRVSPPFSQLSTRLSDP